MSERCPSCGFHLSPNDAVALRRDKFAGIFQRTANAYGTTVDAVMANRRSGSIAMARHVITYILRTEYKLSYPELAAVMQRNHTTMMVAVDKVATRLQREERIGNHSLRDRINAIVRGTGDVSLAGEEGVDAIAAE